MESVEKKQLRKKKTELKAEFSHHKKEVAKIDNLIEQLRNQKEEHRIQMIRAQGAFAVIDSILGPDESAKNKINDNNHGNSTNNVQSKKG